MARRSCTTTPLALVVGLALGSTGCAALKDAAHMREPAVAVSSVRLAALSFEGAELAFAIDIDNPNPVAVALEGVEYDLFVAGKRFLSGRQDQRQQISAAGHSSLELPLRLDFNDLRRTYAALQNQDSTVYEVHSRLTFQIPVLGYRTLGLKRGGHLPVLRVPQVELADIRLERLSLSAADLLIRLRLGNPNAFSLALERLHYDLAVSGHPWASGATVRALPLAARSDQILELPVSVDLSALGAGVYAALMQRRPLDYHLSGGISLSTGLGLLPSADLPLDLAGTVELGRQALAR